MVKTQSSKSVNDMTVGSPLRAIIKFAIPLILGYILQQMYLIIDAAIVGRWIGVGALAAVGASSSIMFLIMGFCNGSCAGFAIPIAQAFGARDYTKMRAYVSNSIRIAICFAVVITFLSCIFCGKILHLVNTPKEVFDDAYIFLMLQFAAIPFTIAYNLLSGQIRALGNSKQPFYFLITASVINIILDGILILGMGLGVEGAGIATWLSQGISVLLCIWFIKKKMQILIPKGEERKFDNKKISILLNNGVPMGLQFSITAIGLIMLQSANNALGTVYVAAFTASMRIKYLFTCVFENIGVAMAVIENCRPIGTPLFSRILIFLLSNFLSSPLGIRICIFFLINQIQSSTEIPCESQVAMPAPSTPSPMPRIRMPSRMMLMTEAVMRK